MTDRTGHCLCGAVTISATDMADDFSSCHCKSCQRWVGGALNGVSVKAENLNITGQEHVGVFQSSNFAERAYCKTCGSALWFRLTAGKYAGNISIPVGLLDDTDGLVLSTEYFTDYKNSTSQLPESRTQLSSADVGNIIADFMSEDAE